MSNQQNQTSDNSIASGQKWQIDLFRPEDAEGVARLFRSVYGAGYPIRTYVEPELLQKENAARRVISSVARTVNGDIVGHNALFQSAPYKRSYESGAGLVHKDYRGGQGILTDMVAHGIEIGQRNFGIELVYGEAVCNHIFSQKVCHKLNLIAQALEVDLMPATAYDKEGSATGRVSTMLCFRTLASRPLTVYLPAVYQKQLKFLYGNLDDTRTLKTADHKLPPKAKTKLDTEVFDFAQVARIAVTEAGDDLDVILNAAEEKLKKAGIKVFQVWLKLAEESVGDAVNRLRETGYFFGGILPRWFDGDGLLLQKIIGRPNWEKIQVHYDNDRKLLEMVHADWQDIEL